MLAGIIIGLSIAHPVARAMEAFGITACNSTAACVGGKNNGTGAAVSGRNKGNATAATSAVYGMSDTSNGVFGRTNSVNGFFAGVYALDPTSGPDNSGVEGLSINGTGVNGGSSNGNGVIASSGSTSPKIAALSLTALVGANLIAGSGSDKLDVHRRIVLGRLRADDARSFLRSHGCRTDARRHGRSAAHRGKCNRAARPGVCERDRPTSRLRSTDYTGRRYARTLLRIAHSGRFPRTRNARRTLEHCVRISHRRASVRRERAAAADGADEGRERQALMPRVANLRALNISLQHADVDTA
jgi:hypothetical protein